MKKITLGVLIVVFLLGPTHSFASEAVVRTGDTVSVAADQTVEGDFYSYSGLTDTTMSGVAKEDMYSVSGTLTANGVIEKDLTAVTGSAQIHGEVKDDVRIIAGDATLGGDIGGDVLVVAGSLKVLSSAKIAGDVIFYGGSAEISGDIGGSILGKSEKMRIDGNVGKDVDIQTAQALSLGENAQVGGNVAYSSPLPLVRAQNTVIKGTVTQNETVVSDSTQKLHVLLYPFFIILFAAFSLHVLFKKQVIQMVEIAHKTPLKAGLVGFATLILGPIASVILFATVLGSLCGAILLSLSVLLFVMGITFSGCMLGSVISKKTTGKKSTSPLWIALGTLCVCTLFFVPFIGPLIVLCVTVVASGTLVLFAYIHA